MDCGANAQAGSESTDIFLRRNFDLVDLCLIWFEIGNFFLNEKLKQLAFLAAHCIFPKRENAALLPREVLAIFGAHDLKNHYEPEKIVLSPRKITIHDEWNPHTTQYDADISLLEFESGKILFSDNSLFIGPICLGSASKDRNRCRVGQERK